MTQSEIIKYSRSLPEFKIIVMLERLKVKKLPKKKDEKQQFHIKKVLEPITFIGRAKTKQELINQAKKFWPNAEIK